MVRANGDHLHNAYHAAGLMIHLDEFEGQNMAAWSRDVIDKETGQPVPEDHRKLVALLPENLSLTRQLMGANARVWNAHQALKETSKGLWEVGRIGWATVKAALVETSIGRAVATGVEKLAEVLRLERVKKLDDRFSDVKTLPKNEEQPSGQDTKNQPKESNGFSP